MHPNSHFLGGFLNDGMIARFRLVCGLLAAPHFRWCRMVDGQGVRTFLEAEGSQLSSDQCATIGVRPETPLPKQGGGLLLGLLSGERVNDHGMRVPRAHAGVGVGVGLEAPFSLQRRLLVGGPSGERIEYGRSDRVRANSRDDERRKRGFVFLRRDPGSWHLVWFCSVQCRESWCRSRSYRDSGNSSR